MQNIATHNEESLLKIYECLYLCVQLDFDDIAEMMFAYSVKNGFSMSYDSIVNYLIKMENIYNNKISKNETRESDKKKIIFTT